MSNTTITIETIPTLSANECVNALNNDTSTMSVSVFKALASRLNEAVKERNTSARDIAADLFAHVLVNADADSDERGYYNAIRVFVEDNTYCGIATKNDKETGTLSIIDKSYRMPFKTLVAAYKHASHSDRHIAGKYWEVGACLLLTNLFNASVDKSGMDAGASTAEIYAVKAKLLPECFASNNRDSRLAQLQWLMDELLGKGAVKVMSCDLAYLRDVLLKGRFGKVDSLSDFAFYDELITVAGYALSMDSTTGKRTKFYQYNNNSSVGKKANKEANKKA